MKKQEFTLVTFVEKWFSHGCNHTFFYFPSVMNTDEQMVLTVRMDREELEKFEYVLKSRELSEGRNYTPDAYISEVIEKEYARMV